MMTPLILDSLKIWGFRAFQDLEVPHLGRVNLITGKNNVGKSGLLEALQIYARRGSPSVFKHLLVHRDETYYSNSMKQDETISLLSDVRHLFHGRPDPSSAPLQIIVGSLLNRDNRVSIRLNYEDPAAFDPQLVLSRDMAPVAQSGIGQLKFSIESNGHVTVLPFAPSCFADRFISGISDKAIKHAFVWSKGSTDRTLSHWWDQVALTDMEDDVVSAMQIISPSISRIGLVSMREGNPDRTPVVKVEEYPTPLPMKSLGEGINRMFGLALALATAGGGLLLVDEIETGLHYSVQTDMWRLIFATAQKLGVQVFATTHSQDCISSFQEAALENEGEEGVLIRLEKRNGNVYAVNFDERKLAIATREHIEVR